MAFGVLAGQITVIFLEVLLGYVGARSGIIKDRLPDVTDALSRQGLTVTRVTEAGEWAAVVACRSLD